MIGYMLIDNKMSEKLLILLFRVSLRETPLLLKRKQERSQHAPVLILHESKFIRIR